MREYIRWKAEENWPMRFSFGRGEEYYILVRQINFSMEPDRSKPELVLTLELKKDLFHAIESLRWFDIPIVYTNRNQIIFDATLPIFLLK